MDRPIWSEQVNLARDKTKFHLDRNESRNGNAIALSKKLLHDAIDESVCQYYDLGKLYSLIEETWNISETNLYLTNGADGAIRYFFEYCLLNKHNKNCILMRPSYGMYEVYASQYFERVNYIDYDNFERKEVNKYEEIISVLRNSEPKSAFVLANPESPTGVAYTTSQIQEIIELALVHEVYLLIDCTYEAYAPSTYRFSSIDEGDNIFFAKSFSKSWSFAGMRLGYLQGNSRSITKIKRSRPMYEIGTLQAKLMEKAIDNRESFERFVSETMEVKTRFLNDLKAINIIAHDTYCNFLHINQASLSKRQTDLLSDIALYKKINHKSLKNYIRLTVPSQDESMVIIEALNSKK